MNHERIHIRQQVECLVLPFYVWYVGEYYYHRFRGKSHAAAYHSISFEKEAYAFEEDSNYLDKRRFGAFLRFLKQ